MSGGFFAQQQNAPEREEHSVNSLITAGVIWVTVWREEAGIGELKCHSVIFKQSGSSAYFRLLCSYLGREIMRHTACGPFRSIPLVLPYPPPPPVLLSKCHSAGLPDAPLRRSFSSHLETLIAVLTALAQYAAHNYRLAHTRCSRHAVQSDPLPVQLPHSHLPVTSPEAHRHSVFPAHLQLWSELYTHCTFLLLNLTLTSSDALGKQKEEVKIS